MNYFRFQTLPAGMQVSNFKFFILLLLLLFIIVGCQSVEKPVRGEEGSGPMTIVIDGSCAEEDAPEYHCNNSLETPYAKIPVIGPLFKSKLKGIDYWRANHPLLVTGTHNPALKSDPDETCMTCHSEPAQACNVCHSYVGVKLVTGDVEE